MMRIAVDVHVVGGMFQGSRRYVENMYEAAWRTHREQDYVFATHPREALGKPWTEMGTVVDFGTHSSLRRLTTCAAQLARRHKFDVFHFQHVAPLFCPCPVAVTIHDILPETHPAYFTRRFRLSRRFLFRRSVKKAGVVFTVSEYSKASIEKHYGVPPDKIVITPNGVDLEQFHPHNRDESIDLVAQRYGVRDYLLTVGRLEPRKNHLTLIEAYHRLRLQRHNPPPLVIAGQRDFGFDGVFRRIEELQLTRDVVILEDVDNGTLPHLYRAAQTFVYMSWAEGFGIPPLEAMACGCPVIASNTTALPEVVGDAGRLLPPEDVEGLAITIDQLLSDAQARAALSQAGIERAKCFSWDASATNMIRGFERLG